MRYETCPYCFMLSATGQDQKILAVIVLSETVSQRVHHHHVMQCDTCKAWWFDDVVAGKYGFVQSLRDTVICKCPDDTCTPIATEMPWPESECHCTAEIIDNQGKLKINLE